MRFKAGLIGLALAGTLIAGWSAASAQPAPCASDDLRCRIDRLEAKLAALEGTQTTLAAKQAQIPIPPPPAPFELVRTYEQCGGSCAQAATALCKGKGFVGGVVKEWERPKIGPIMLRSAICER